MISEITKKEFKERFPEVSTYGLDNHMPVYLDNGVVLIDKEWNGEEYTIKDAGRERIFRPIHEPAPDYPDDVVIVGYEEV